MKCLLKIRLIAVASVAIVLLGPGARAADPTAVPMAPLDHGFQLLYNLDFERADDIFTRWEEGHPDDPMGPTANAAGRLFSEFHRLGILESQFFADDKEFENRPKLTPDPRLRERFNKDVEKAQQLARARLARNSKDKDALLAMTLTTGLEADYAALIERRNLASLHYTKQSTQWGEQTLAADPNCFDAHIAGGISKYLIGSMAAPVRWLVRLGGIAADKQAGIKELKIVAERGHYLAPFANILLAIAYVREHDKRHARELLASLHDQFPDNPLFVQEMARLDSAR